MVANIEDCFCFVITQIRKRLKKLGEVGASKMEGGAEVAATKVESEVAGPVAPVSIFSPPEDGRGNPPPAAFFWPFHTLF